MASYSAQVDKRVAETKALMLAVRRESIERHIELMQEPGPSKATAAKAVGAGAGLGKTKANGSRGVSKRAYGPITNPGGTGNLPVDSGFLRASLVVGIGSVSVPVTTPPPEPTTFTWDEGQVELAIAGADIDDPIEARYTAVYARVAEYGGPNRMGRRFVGLAAQRWVQIVESVVADLKAGKGI